MIVRSLALMNFRNYEKLEMEFSPAVNILFGDNAQGKTNVLEAVYLAGTTKSHKAAKDREMIRLGEDEAHLRMIVEKEITPGDAEAGTEARTISHKIDMHLKAGRAKGIAIDGVPVRRSQDLFGMVHMIFFAPEDLNMIKSGPGERRRFLDMEISQVDKIYLHNLTQYNKALQQRNNLLRQIAAEEQPKDMLSVWDEQLVRFGTVVIKEREKFVEKLNVLASDVHRRLTGGKERLEMVYEPNVRPEDFAGKLARHGEIDLIQRTTLVGPQRDDIRFMIDGIDIRKFGSQGQQRTAALSVKLSEIDLFRAETHEDPVLLLDDVFSELDRNRQNYLLTSIGDIQTLITCTGLEEFVAYKKDTGNIYKVVEGTVERYNGE